MSTPRISVVVPSYRSAQTIGQALDSVITQQRPADEIIIVDDASPDDTYAKTQSWCQQRCLRTEKTTENHSLWIGPANIDTPPVITIRQKENTGPAGARNAGIRQAQGDWIAFLDADDCWMPERLAIQHRVVEVTPDADMICGGTIDLPNDLALPETGSSSFQPTHDATIPPIHRLTLKDFVAHNPVATSTVLIKRQVLVELEGFDEQFRGPEDYDLWLRVVATRTVVLIPTPLSRYRQTVGSLSMDDRTFLPQVLGVLEKGFRNGGALSGHQNWRRKSFAEQYASASWMAYNRGDRRTALRHLFASWFYYQKRIHKEEEDLLQRAKLLFRYLSGRRPDVQRVNETTD